MTFRLDDADDGINYDEVARDYDPAKKHLTPLVITAEALLFIGVLVASFLFYQFVIVDAKAEHQQASAVTNLRDSWNNNSRNDAPRGDDQVPDGAMGILSSDTLGGEYPLRYGTSQDVLAQGPGIYESSPELGGIGNVAIAAHRDGWNAPFSEIDKLETCDVITLEDQDRVYSYSVLSSDPDPQKRFEENSECFYDGTAEALNAMDYDQVRGQQIVDPSMGRVAWAVPGVSEDNHDASVRLLTLTSCHPHMSNQQRIIVQAALSYVRNKE